MALPGKRRRVPRKSPGVGNWGVGERKMVTVKVTVPYVDKRGPVAVFVGTPNWQKVHKTIKTNLGHYVALVEKLPDGSLKVLKQSMSPYQTLPEPGSKPMRVLAGEFGCSVPKTLKKLRSDQVQGLRH